MISQGRQDLISIACAFVGAGVVRRVVPPFDGLPPIVMSIAGAALGIMFARSVFNYLKIKETKAALQKAQADREQNDTQFAHALYGDDELDQK